MFNLIQFHHSISELSLKMTPNNVLIVLILVIISNLQHIHARTLYTWSQVVPQNQLSVRAITDDNACPIARVDNKQVEMKIRSSMNNTETVCELIVDRLARHITVDDKKIATLPKNIRKIAIIGDTGCRIKGDEQQACNSAEGWPLRKNLEAIALHKPELIVHVGDYLYRQTKCLETTSCGNLFGYNPETWYADWFDPARDISLRAPFIFIRGNHEACGRGHEGWFRYLDPFPFAPENCKPLDFSWAFDVGPVKFFIFDTSSPEEIFERQRKINAFNKFNSLICDKPTWFLTHRPLWCTTTREPEVVALKSQGNLTDIEEFQDEFPKNVSAILSGHFHIAQILLMDDFPDQIIVGNGGALLYAQDQKPIYKNVDFHYPNGKNYSAHDIRNFFGFGFAIARLDSRALMFFNSDNKRLYSAGLTDDFKPRLK
uniref:SP49.7 n=1 Tax=Bemisia tabaci TaxID=7038 RepID=A0A7S5LK46_BEMTA|nr:SP49.7 [Bemisia tabaci]